MESSESWEVRFSPTALEDLSEIIQFLLNNEDRESAGELFELILREGRSRLATMPLRGRVVPELESVTGQYREIRVKSWRVVYRAIPEQRIVRIMLIVHVRRDIQDMLLGRLLGSYG